MASKTSTTNRANENDRLIAAAPDLLKACRAAFFQFEHNGEESDSDREVLDQLQAAIAKATGDQTDAENQVS